MPVFTARAAAAAGGGFDLVAQIDVVDGTAIGDDETGKLPFVAQDVLDQQVASTRRLSIDAVVGAHERIRARFTNAGLEVREVRLAEVTFAHDRIECVALGFGSAVDGEVFHGGDRLEVLRMVALKPADELNRQPACEERIFAEGFLAASPTRVAEDVDVR